MCNYITVKNRATRGGGRGDKEIKRERYRDREEKRERLRGFEKVMAMLRIYDGIDGQMMVVRVNTDGDVKIARRRGKERVRGRE